MFLRSYGRRFAEVRHNFTVSRQRETSTPLLRIAQYRVRQWQESYAAASEQWFTSRIRSTGTFAQENLVNHHVVIDVVSLLPPFKSIELSIRCNSFRAPNPPKKISQFFKSRTTSLYNTSSVFYLKTGAKKNNFILKRSFMNFERVFRFCIFLYDFKHGLFVYGYKYSKNLSFLILASNKKIIKEII